MSRRRGKEDQIGTTKVIPCTMPRYGKKVGQDKEEGRRTKDGKQKGGGGDSLSITDECWRFNVRSATQKVVRLRDRRATDTIPIQGEKRGD